MKYLLNSSPLFPFLPIYLFLPSNFIYLGNLLKKQI